MPRVRGKSIPMFLHTFRVRGDGSFPVDMLRYDSCFPATEGAASLIERSIRDGALSRDREVTLHAWQHRDWTPTHGRWESFNWKIVEGTHVAGGAPPTI
jgi:hypothetical protein